MCRPHLLNAKLDGALSVRIPLSHDGKDLRNGCGRLDESLETFQAAQIEKCSFRLLTLVAEWSLSRRMSERIRSHNTGLDIKMQLTFDFQLINK